MREWKVVDKEGKEIKKIGFRNYGGHSRPDYNDLTVCWIVIDKKRILFSDPCLSFDHDTKTITFDKDKLNENGSEMIFKV